ncbi:DUF3995 domain-containing protein [Paenibacillus doosanensis]|uniref:DUF3995 domain-containing protein n=1 Tax=Paenibacillus doosanensis TaxID=1229154 RepID=UPI00217FE5A7|nr:DUF3995 domain-containing protein [Paenibacillus doosanensis]MCS7462538.1 DUF3995 domain-containing protein [Paenibacillus doosanensis]
MAYMLPHLYWALGGKMGGGILKPDLVHSLHFEFINWIATVFLTVAGLIGLAFIYWNKGKVFSYMLLFISWAGCSVAASHGIFGIVYRILQISGGVGLESGTFHINEDAYVLWDLVLFEPWFLIEGILLGIVGWCFLKEARGRIIWLAACILGVIFGLVTGIMGVRFA